MITLQVVLITIVVAVEDLAVHRLVGMTANPLRAPGWSSVPSRSPVKGIAY